jgi:cold shock protein
MNKPDRLTGVVKFFKEDRGFGFIEVDEGREIFLHVNQWVEEECPAKGERVSFIVDRGTRGPIARQVMRA